MATAATAPGLPTGAARWIVIGTLLLALFLYTLNSKGAVLLSNEVVQDLDLDHYKAQWFTGSQGVAGSLAIFTGIYLVSLWGVRRTFLVGACCLTFGAVGTVFVQYAWQEAIAGVVRNCVSLWSIPSLTLLMQLLPRRKGIVYCTCLAMVYGGQIVAEPLGALLAYHPSWRALFVIIAVCGSWCILCAVFLFPHDVPAGWPDKPFDFAGAGLLGLWLAILFFLLYRGNYLGWLVSTRICLAFVALGAVTGLFVWRELVAPQPFINLRGLTYRTAALTTFTGAFWCASLYGITLQLPNYLLLRGYQHATVGLVTLPMSLVLVATMVSGGLLVRRGHWVWALRLGLTGMTLLGFQIARVDLYTSWQALMALTIAWAVCAGICLPAIARLVYEGQLPAEAAATGSVKFLVRSLGSTLGVLLAAVLLDQATAWGLEYVRTSLTPALGTLQVVQPSIQDHMERHGSAPAAGAAQTSAVIGHWVHLHAQIIGFRAALRFCAISSGIALLIALFISQRKETSMLDADDNTLPEALRRWLGRARRPAPS
jgi:DHA2 family lincomycin resistance protein-like MFS transporter